MAFLVAGSIPDGFFPWGHLKDYLYAVPPKTIEVIAARFRPDVTTVDANVLRRVQENAVRRTAVCIRTVGDRFEQLL
jgi:hypothetical protein